MVRFQRLLGAAADVQELAYIAALHQTCVPATRENATVSSVDIQRLLSSRYGLLLSAAECLDLVRGLGGGMSQQEVLVHSRQTKNYLSLINQAVKHSLESGAIRKHKMAEVVETLKNSAQKATRLNSMSSRKKKKSSDEVDEEMGSGQDPLDTSVVEEKEADGEEGNSNKDAEDPLKNGQDEEDGEEGENPPKNGQDEEVGEEGEDPPQNGQDKEDDDDLKPEEYLDLVQLVAILIIPTLARAGREFGQEEPDKEEEEPLVEGWYANWKQKRDKERAQRAKDSEESLRPQPRTLIQDVLAMVLKDIESEYPGEAPILDVDLIEAIMLEQGEKERAQNKDLLREMVDAAMTPSGRLDPAAFCQALTSDLSVWDVESDRDVSTYYEDVYEPRRSQALAVEESAAIATSDDGDNDVKDDKEDKNVSLGAATDEDKQDASGQNHNSDAKSTALKSIVPALGVSKRFAGHKALDTSNIDYVVDSHVSVAITVAIWAFYFMTAFSYATLFQAMETSTACVENGNGGEFGCQLVQVLWSWMSIAVFLTLFGVAIILPISLGNNPLVRKPRRRFFAFFMVLVYTFVPYFVVNNYEDSIEGRPDTSPEKRVNSIFWDSLQNVVLVVGLLLAALMVWSLSVMVWKLCIGSRARSFSGIWAYWTTTSNTHGEYRSKLAASRKVSSMLLNAHELHDLGPAQSVANSSMYSLTFSTEQSMLNYVLQGQREEPSGGIIWTFKLLWSGRLFDTEGIWLPTRLLVFQFAQILVFAFLALVYASILRRARDAAAEAQVTLDDDLPDWVISIVPTEQDVVIALVPATTIANVVSVIIILLYIPSAVSTILQYRCGALPSLGSPYFIKFRNGVDTAYMNTGNAIYGLLGASSLFFFIVGLVIFLFIWDFSRPLMLRLLAWGIGLACTISLKILLVRTFHKSSFKSFYRTKPRKANFISLCLECWHIGLGSSVLVGRITQFLCAAVFWVGRIDVPFLSEEVRLFGYAFDYVPRNFTKDLLVHEAHRHPYLERIAQMYLMKLRHGSSFSSDAGAAWRHVFVQALLPWLRKYRVFNEERISQAMTSLAKERLVAEEDAKGVATLMGEDLRGAAKAAGGHGTKALGHMKAETNAVVGVAEDAAGTAVEIALDAAQGVTGAVNSASGQNEPGELAPGTKIDTSCGTDEK